MSDIWFISDIHAFHKNILSFKDSDGRLIREQFAPQDPTDAGEVSRCLKHFHDAILTNINRCVTPSSKLYNLGDTTMYHGDAFKDWYKLINTQQHRLLFGNHDDPNRLVRMNIFKKTGIWRNFKTEDFVASHVPVHRGSMKTAFNLHGHTHQNLVLGDDGQPDLHYINICVEHTNYHPVHMDDILQTIRKRREILNGFQQE